MDDPPGRRVDDQRRTFRDRMADRHELHLERPGLDHLRARLDRGDRVFRQTRLFKLQPADGGGEFAGIDRLAQRRPQMRQRADMVFMRVGDEDRLQPRQIVASAS